MIWAIAFPPPPPDIFSNDVFFTKPDFLRASPTPRAVPSQPPPAPPGIKKWIDSTPLATELEANPATKHDANATFLHTLLIMIFHIFSFDFESKKIVIKKNVNKL